MIAALKVAVIAGLVADVCLSCLASAAGADPAVPSLLDPDSQVVQALNGFSYEIFNEIAGAAGDTNVLVSPFSIACALGMAYNGASGAVRDSIKSVLGLATLPDSLINSVYGRLQRTLRAKDTGLVLEIANSIWIREGFGVRSPFVETCRRYFAGEVKSLDFDAPGARDTINQWVGERTRGLIRSIVPAPIGGDVVLYLLNAIYFDAKWRYRFDPRRTQPARFFLTSATHMICDMMYLTGDLLCTETDDAQVACLPYADSQLEMLVVLPKDTIPGSLLAELIDPIEWRAWLQKLESCPVEIYLPKFRSSYSVDLRDALTNLGMGTAFTTPDFRGIDDRGRLFISKALHKAVVAVEEEGTEGAAATALELRKVITLNPKMVLRADRPFLFVIRHSLSGLILFMGKIVRPAQIGF